MIKEFDRENLKTLRTDIDSALAQIASKHNIQLSLGTIRFGTEEATTRLTMRTRTTSNGVKVEDTDSAAAIDFKKHAALYGFKPEHLGATFKFGRDMFKIVGLVPSRPKYPVSAQNLSTGRKFKFRPQDTGLAKPPLPLFGSAPVMGAPKHNMGVCQNENAFDSQFNPVGKCGRQATSRRKVGFGRSGEIQNLCDDCTRLHDEAVAENKAEARMS